MKILTKDEFLEQYPWFTLDQALRAQAKRSKCVDRKVGAVIVSLARADKDAPIVAASRNFTPCDAQCMKFSNKPCPAIHAERQVISLCYELFANAQGMALVVTYPPCDECIAHAEQMGIEIVVHWPLEPEVPMEAALALVRAYHKRLGLPVVQCSKEDKYRQARELMLAMHQEVAELTDSIQWKPWRAARNHAHHNMLEESADILFFMDSLFMLFGISWADLAQAIADKVEVTDNRIKEGYHS